jgi:hypothetical protein
MLREVTRQWESVEIDVFEGLLVDYARKRGAAVCLYHAVRADASAAPIAEIAAAGRRAIAAQSPDPKLRAGRRESIAWQQHRFDAQGASPRFVCTAKGVRNGFANMPCESFPAAVSPRQHAFDTANLSRFYAGL